MPKAKLCSQRAGFGAAAAAAWASRPRTLEVDPAGLTLLDDIRPQLRLMPPGIRLADLHDPTPLHLAVSGATRLDEESHVPTLNCSTPASSPRATARTTGLRASPSASSP